MFKNLPVELVVWLGALLFLAFSKAGTEHYSLCPLDNAGLSWCPGCGLGRSLRYLLQGEIRSSLDQHWFGIPALFILIHRIVQLLKKIVLNLDISNLIQHGK